VKPALLVMFAAASPCFAQWSFEAIVISTGRQVEVEYSLSFTEVDAISLLPVTSANGSLDPGEAAMMQLRMFITTPVGTPVLIPAQHGYQTPGLLGGLWSGNIDIVGDAGALSARGLWTVNGSAGVAVLGNQAPFNAGGVTWNGTPVANGTRLNDIAPAQFGANPQALNQQNPVAPIWLGVWAPDSFEPRTVSFELGLGTSALPSQVWGFVDWYPLPAIGSATSTYSGVQIPIVPAPGITIPPMLSAAFLLRRRRR
jgi:hypothetical protein